MPQGALQAMAGAKPGSYQQTKSDVLLKGLLEQKLQYGELCVTYPMKKTDLDDSEVGLVVTGASLLHFNYLSITLGDPGPWTVGAL